MTHTQWGKPDSVTRKICSRIFFFVLLLACSGMHLHAKNVKSQKPAKVVMPQESLDALRGLVAPLALYPDALLNQILAAALNPEDIVKAADWINENQNTTGEKAVAATQTSHWHASVKALITHPDVLQLLANDINWTAQLGKAWQSAPQQVMEQIQILRQQAVKEGHLRENRNVVLQEKNGHIQILAKDVGIAYMPSFNPRLVYGQDYWKNTKVACIPASSCMMSAKNIVWNVATAQSDAAIPPKVVKKRVYVPYGYPYYPYGYYGSYWGDHYGRSGFYPYGGYHSSGVGLYFGNSW